VASTPTQAETAALLATSNANDFGGLEVLAMRFIRQHPDAGMGWAALGLALIRQERFRDALEPLRTAARLLPKDASSLSNLGFALVRLNLRKQAEAALRKAIERDPQFVSALVNLGGLLVKQQRHVEAEPFLLRSLQLNPASFDALNNLAVAKEAQGKAHDAIAVLTQASRLSPSDVSVLRRLASLLRRVNRLPEADAVWNRSLEIEPENPDVLSEFSGALIERADATEVERLLTKALALRPGDAATLINLGRLRYYQGRFQDAREAYGAAVESEPNVLGHQVIREAALPMVADGVDQIRQLRDDRRRGFMGLGRRGPSEHGEYWSPLSFYLAYHGENDRELMEIQAGTFRSLRPELTYVAPHIPKWRPVKTKRIKIGLVSEYFRQHTIGKLYEGLIQNLDRGRFEVVLFHAPAAARDFLRQRLDAMVDKAVDLPLGFPAMHAAVAAEQLDVLFYPDIGMSPTTYYLAFARLAPVQAVSWGHPDTTGLDTIDYFLSSAAIEPPDADAAYTETLIRLPRLPCCYAATSLPEERPSRTALGLPATGRLYGCPQTLWKIHPEFDQVLADIATGDPDGHIVMIEGHPPALTELLCKRWSRTAPILLKRVRWLPRLDLTRFISLLDHTDVLLDPIHFGSGNTLYEGMALGVPVVTWPGRFARGRIVAGAYQQMQIADAPIAATIEDYAPLALSLGRDPARRGALRQAMREAATRELFSDMRAVRQIEDFLTAAVASASRREKLPPDWKTP